MKGQNCHKKQNLKKSFLPFKGRIIEFRNSLFINSCPYR